MPVDIDEETLRAVASRTGGKYYRVTDSKQLERVFGEIDRMQKTEIKSTVWVAWEDRFAWFLLPAALLFGLELLFELVILRRLP